MSGFHQESRADSRRVRTGPSRSNRIRYRDGRRLALAPSSSSRTFRTPLNGIGTTIRDFTTYADAFIQRRLRCLGSGRRAQIHVPIQRTAKRSSIPRRFTRSSIGRRAPPGALGR